MLDANGKRILQNVAVVMVGTTLPANIGSAARAMKTSGLERLILVDPKSPIDETSYAHAKGGGAILDNAQTAPSLEAALADAHVVFAASGRLRHLPRPVVSPRQAAALMEDIVARQSPENLASGAFPKFAFLFGRESSGLTNEELSFAHYHVQICANPEYASLNVAGSVQVVGSFLYDYFAKKENGGREIALTLRQQWDEPPVAFAEQRRLFEASLALFGDLGLIDDANSALPNRLRRLLGRAQLDKKECALLTALVYRLRKKLDKGDGAFWD